jgi:hypothetical protein
MPVVKYYCEFCNSAFDTQPDALACEKSHLKIKKARPTRYAKGPYPVFVEVEFTNGTRKTYIEEDTYWRR